MKTKKTPIIWYCPLSWVLALLKWIERTAAALHARLELWGELTRRILGVWG